MRKGEVIEFPLFMLYASLEGRQNYKSVGPLL